MDPLEDAFPYLESEGRDLLRARSREQQYTAGETIVEDGAPVPALYVIASGMVSVQKMHLGGGVPVADLGPGALVGEVSYLDGCSASASVVARTDVTALVIEGVDDLLTSSPELAAGFYRSLATVLAGRLRYGNEDRVVTAFLWG
jgi:extracellular factor (EF) 3-hydroxypalmitic acid methyl ester biosynthesis protein